MELVYEVAPFSDWLKSYLAILGFVVVVIAVIVFLSVRESGDSVAGFNAGVASIVLVFGIFGLIPLFAESSSKEIDAKRDAISEVYDNVDYDGGRFMYGSRDGYYVKATVTDLGDNKILVQEFDIE